MNWKMLFRNLALLLGISLSVGPFLLLFLVFGALGAYPPYVTYGGLAVGVVGLLALFLGNCDYFPTPWHRYLCRGMLLVLAAAAIYVGHGVWRDSLPTVDDRDLLLWEYEPFAEHSKAAKLKEASTLQLTRWDQLRLDGATALYPVYAAFVQAAYPKGDYSLHGPGTPLVDCSGTILAYERLIAGETDLIFAAAPSQAQLELAENAGMELHLTPIGREAFVFFVNSKNPVENLTVEQIQGIYTGKFTNWHQLGGKWQSVRPFQRPENSGSQTALQHLMNGLPLLEPEEEDRITGMDGIIRQVANYRNYQNAIGFSFRFYATEMVTSNEIRLLALDGVAPTQETIRDGSYPLSSAFYAVTAAPVGAPAPRESNPVVRSLLDWILSEQGQTLVEQTGYVALS